MEPAQCSRVLVIGSPYAHHNREMFLQKFTRILSEIANSVCVIGANEPADRSNVSWTKIEIPNEAEGIRRQVRFFTTQVRAISIAKSQDTDYDTVFIRTTQYILPSVWARLAGKQTGTIVTQKTVHPLINKMRKTNLYLSKNLIVESPSVLAEWDRESYSYKTLVGATYVDEEQFKKTRLYEDRNNVVGYLGTLNERKGVGNLLEAFEQLASENHKLSMRIGGTGPLENNVSSLSEEYGSVDYRGFVPDEKLCEFYNDLRLLVLPSTSEGLPNVALEAMACGTPVLATPVGGLPDIIDDERTGFLMKSNDPTSIVENVRRAMTFSHLSEVSESASQIVEEQYRLDSAISRYRHILKSGLR